MIFRGPLGVLLNNQAPAGSEYQGQVMGGCHEPLYLATDATSFNSQSPHFAMDSGSRLRIGIPNWYDRETAGAGSVAYSASIMDAGQNVLGQFLFSGSATGTAAAGDTLISDWLNVNYARGTKYLIRIHGSGASGFVFNQPPSGAPDTANGSQYDRSASDKTLGGSITVLSAFYDFCPIFIEGDTRRPSVLLAGDSLMYRGAANQGDSFDGASPNVGYAERVLGGLGIAYINASSPGEKAQQYVAAHSVRAALASRVSHVWCGYGFNDINGGRTAAQAIADLQAIWGYFPTKRVVQAYISYGSTGAWTLADGSDQTVPASFGPAGAVDTVNAAIAAGAGLYGRSDYRPAVFNLTNHKWLADGTVGKYTPDGIHNSQFAAKAIASSGLITASLFSRAGL